ncbi:MAG: T9SS type A sorting domain-containing protein [Bacteroidia bacterium]|nr:T9SS type A sorting domain-containing protein [Bacteroidia bacterium]
MSSTPLPVEWLNFTAQWIQEGVTARLNWSTASEKNNSHFTILRSTDGQTWEEINMVTGAGTTNTASAYQYIDHTLSHINTSTHQQVYYRIMQTDFNGQFSLSDMRELKIELQTKISVSPNPGATQVITLQQAAPVDLPYTIVDMQGKEVSSGIILKGNTQQAISLQQLPAGVYLLSIEQAGITERIKLIRQ